MSYSFYLAPSHRHTTHSSVVTFLQQDQLHAGVHTIRVSPVVNQDFLLEPREGAPLVVAFHGAVSRDSVTLPYFEGRFVLSEVPASKLFVADASLGLDPQMTLAWHAGSSTFPAQVSMVQIIARIAEVLRSKQVVLFGGSGGGFAALYYSRRLPGSICMIWNPQTDLTRYSPTVLERYARSAWGVPSESLPALVTTSVVDLYQQPVSDGANKVIYLQNRSDWHVRAHMQPLMKGCGIRVDLDSGRQQVFKSRAGTAFKVTLGDWGTGHKPPPKALLAHYLSSIVLSCP
jgi:pimeloyl-ACP methyl ester carboxylesterase